MSGRRHTSRGQAPPRSESALGGSTLRSTGSTGRYGGFGSSSRSHGDLHRVGGGRVSLSTLTAMQERSALGTGARLLVGRAERSGAPPSELFDSTPVKPPAAVTLRPTLGSTTLQRPSTFAHTAPPSGATSPIETPGSPSLASTAGSLLSSAPRGPGASSTAAASRQSFEFTVQRGDNKWQHVGRPEPALERPAARSDILALERQYRDAVSHAQTFLDRMERTRGTAAAGLGQNPVLDNDMFSCNNAASEVVDSQFKPDPDRGTDHKAALNEVTWRLAGTLFQQKWTDLVLADVSSQVGISCLEHGALLNRLREGTADIFSEYKRIIKVLLSTTASAITTIDTMDRQHEAERKRAQEIEAVYEQKYEKKVAEIYAEMDAYRSKADIDVNMAKEQMERMSETLRTLNVAFKQMRSDDKAMRVSDLRLAVNQLEAKLSHRTAEVESLLPLRDQLDDAEANARDTNLALGEAKTKLAATQQELREKTILVQDLLQKEADRMAEAELLATQQSEKGAAGGGDASGAAGSGQDGSGSGAGSATGGGKRRGNTDTVLCARCHAELDSLNAKDEQTDDDDSAVACLHYRVLLPNMPRTDEGPFRSYEWIRWVMRAVILSKLRADSVAERNGAPRVRMPEFVYSWFQTGTSLNVADPDGIARAVTGADAINTAQLNITASEEAARLLESMNEVDGARWALYYGVRQLAKSVVPGSGSFEAKLFYNFLDERYGEDELTFYLFCLRTIESVIATPIEWGPTTHSSSFSCIPERIDMVRRPPRDIYGKVVEPDPMPSQSGNGPAVPPVMWIGLKKALAAAGRILARASEQDRHITLRRIKAKAVEITDQRLIDQVTAPDPPNFKSAMATLQGLGGEHRLENHLSRLAGTSAPRARQRVRKPAKELRCVDLFVVLRMLLVEYREEQAHRRAAIAMMFDAAAESKLAMQIKELENERQAVKEAAVNEAVKRGEDPDAVPDPPPINAPRPIPRSQIVLDLRQISVVVSTLNNEASMAFIAGLFRDSYDHAKGGVTLASFTREAERRQLFSDALRLPPFTGSTRSTTLSKEDLERIASLVHRRFRLLELDLSAWLSVLPDPWAAQLRYLKSAVTQELSQTGNGFSVDGRRALTAYRRFLMYLLFVRMCRREEVGEAGGPLAVRHLEKELETFEGVIRTDAPALLAGPEEVRRIKLMLGHRAAARLLSGQDPRGADEDDGLDEEDDEDEIGVEEGKGHDEEEDGDENDDDNQARLDQEGYDDILALGLSQAVSGDPRVLVRTSWKSLRFNHARRSLCAARIQRAFRYKSLPPEGVPFHMRIFMHRWYNPRTGGLRRREIPRLTDFAPHVDPISSDTPTGSSRRVSLLAAMDSKGMQRGWLKNVASSSAPLEPPPVPEAEVDEERLASMEETKAVDAAARSVSLAIGYGIGRDELRPTAESLNVILPTLSQIYLAKIRSDKDDDERGIPHQTMLEFVYDFFMQLFGVREVAERELHQLFTSVREHASRHPRVRLFALFCGIPLTRTESTKHGYFILDTHLEVRDKVAKAAAAESAEMDPLSGPGAAAGGGEDTAGINFSAAEASGVQAAEAPTFGVASREREAAIERELCSPAAVAFYNKVLLALGEDALQPSTATDDLVSAVESSAKKRASGSKDKTAESKEEPDVAAEPPAPGAGNSLLFPVRLQPSGGSKKNKNPGVPVSYIRVAHAQRVAEFTLHALSDASSDRVLRRLSSYVEDGLVDMDMVLRLCLEEWAAETYKRGQKLAALFHAGDVDTNGVLSLDEFTGVIRHVRPKGSETEAVRMFREASLLTEQRIRKRTGGSSRLHAGDDGSAETEIDVVSFLEVARMFGLSTVKLEGGRDVPASRDPDTLAQLLKLTWAVYKDGIDVDSQLEFDSPAEIDTEPEIVTSLAKFKTRYERFSTLLTELEATTEPVEETVEAAWLAFRLLLSDWGRFRQLLGDTQLPQTPVAGGAAGAGRA